MLFWSKQLGGGWGVGGRLRGPSPGPWGWAFIWAVLAGLTAQGSLPVLPWLLGAFAVLAGVLGVLKANRGDR